MKTDLWEKQAKEAIKQNEGTFGHNRDVDIIRILRRIDRITDYGCLIEVPDYYTVKIKLPTNPKIRSIVLLNLLTYDSVPNSCRYNTKKDILTLEWHI